MSFVRIIGSEVKQIRLVLILVSIITFDVTRVDQMRGNEAFLFVQIDGTVLNWNFYHFLANRTNNLVT